MMKASTLSIATTLVLVLLNGEAGSAEVGTAQTRVTKQAPPLSAPSMSVTKKKSLKPGDLVGLNPQPEPPSSVAHPRSLSKQQAAARFAALDLRYQAMKSLGAKVDPAAWKELSAARDSIRSSLDSMSELGEMESLRMQAAMDRLSKSMSTMSNLLKKQSETASGITQNLK